MVDGGFQKKKKLGSEREGQGWIKGEKRRSGSHIGANWNTVELHQLENT